MIKNKSVTAIILIAGSSERFGKKTNKNFELLNNKPLFIYSIDTFLKSKYIDNIILVIKKEEEKIVGDELKKHITNNIITLVVGGKTRDQSVYNALLKTKDDIVIIHDGARPLIKDEYINNCLYEMDNYKGVTIGVKSKDTIKITNNDEEVIETTVRKNTWLIQTPQCFDRKILFSSHKKIKDKQNITDDCSLLENCGYKIKIIEGDYMNIKVTTKEDIYIINVFKNNVDML